MALLMYGIVAVPVLYLVYWLVKPLYESCRLPPATDFVHQYIDPKQSSASDKVVRHSFPSLLEDAPSLYLSLIVPAFDEEKRLPGMLNETLLWLQEKQQKNAAYTYEIIVVDDGSRDRTSDVALEKVRQFGCDRIRLMRLAKNQGKGGAVQQGMLHARGQYLLMVDADAATQISDLDRLEASLIEIQRDGAGMVVGSRSHLQDDAVAKRKWYRNILMYGFHFLVSTLCVKGVRDTQCGFKLFTRKCAQHVFVTQHLRRWSFDVELLFVAQHLKFPVGEVAVNWTEIPGSKLSIVSASLNMARDMFLIRIAYLLRIWRIKNPNSVRKSV